MSPEDEAEQADWWKCVPFEEGIETTTWTFENGDRLWLEKSTSGYEFGGVVSGKTLCDDNGEDWHFEDTDSLLEFLSQHGLLTLLSKRGDT